MSKVRPHFNGDGSIAGYVFHCPGCEHVHIFYTSGPIAWAFTGDVVRPTFTPSLLNTCPNHPDPKQRRCHLYVTNGSIIFLDDCSHWVRAVTCERKTRASLRAKEDESC